MSNISQGSTITNPLTPLEEAKAANALDALLSAPNQERRGRPTDETLVRVHNFLKTDEAFLEHKRVAPLVGVNPIHFEAEMIGQLKWIDKLISNNPGVINLADLGPDRVNGYRYISTMTLLALSPSSANIGNQSAESKKIITVPWSNIAETNILSISELPAADPLIQNNRKQKQSHSQKTLDSLLDDIIRFNNHELTSFREHLDLAEKVDQVFLDPATSSQDRDIIKSWLSESDQGVEHLASILGLSKAAEKLKNIETASFKDCHVLAFNLNQLKDAYTPFQGNRYELLVKEGILSSETKETVLQIISIKDPVTNRLAAKMLEDHDVTPNQLIQLNTVVENFRSAQKDSAWIEAKLSEPLKSGPTRIQHLKNVSELALLGVETERLLGLSGQNANLIHEVVAGQFDIVPRSNSHYKKLTSKAIESGLRLIKEDPAIQEVVLTATKSIRQLGDYSTFQIQDVLQTFAKNSPQHVTSLQLTQLGESISRLNRAGLDFTIIRDIVEFGPKQLGHSGEDKVAMFLKNLSTLQQNNVKGIGEHLKSAHIVLTRRENGDDSQNILGFVMEAKTAIDLGEHGYQILALSQTVKTNFQYDILAKSPKGELYGIEVKSSLDGFVDKNYKKGLFALDDIEKTQVYRHVRSALIDGVVPVIAVLPVAGHTFNTTSAAHLFDMVKSKLKVAPVLIHRIHGEELNVHTAFKK
jgi:hypothetical protein